MLSYSKQNLYILLRSIPDSGMNDLKSPQYINRNQNNIKKGELYILLSKRSVSHEADFMKYKQNKQ